MKTTETEVLLLLCASQLLIAADTAPGGLRKRLQNRGEELLDEANEERVGPQHVGPLYVDPPYAPGYEPRTDNLRLDSTLYRRTVMDRGVDRLHEQGLNVPDTEQGRAAALAAGTDPPPADVVRDQAPATGLEALV